MKAFKLIKLVWVDDTCSMLRSLYVYTCLQFLQHGAGMAFLCWWSYSRDVFSLLHSSWKQIRWGWLCLDPVCYKVVLRNPSSVLQPTLFICKSFCVQPRFHSRYFSSFPNYYLPCWELLFYQQQDLFISEPCLLITSFGRNQSDSLFDHNPSLIWVKIILEEAS